MFYPQEIIDKIIDESDIVGIIGSYVKLTKKSGRYFGLCPFHNEKTPSFSVVDNGDRKMFYCFGCHTGGSVITFLMKYENLSYIEAVKFLAERAGIELPKADYSKASSLKAKLREDVLSANKEAAVYFFHMLKSKAGGRGRDYLKNRGLSAPTITAFGLGYAGKQKNDLYNYLKDKGFSDETLKNTGLFSIRETETADLFWNRVMFPIMDLRGRVIGFGGRVMGEGNPKYLNSPETVCFDKSRNLYALNIARKSGRENIILCEGYMDVISLHQAGFSNAVASLGTALTDGHCALLKKYTKNVYISYDADGAGQNAALKAVAKLRDAGLAAKVINLSPYKDPDELIKACGADEYKNRIKNAANGFMFELGVLSQSFDLQDPGGLTRFGNEALSRISRFDDALERENYVNSVCKQYGFDKNVLSGKLKELVLSNEILTENKAYNYVDSKGGAFEKKSNTPGQIQKFILASLAKDFTLLGNLKKYVSFDYFTHPYDIIARLLFAGIENGRVNPSGIVSAFEDEDDQQTAADVMYFDFSDTEGGERNKLLNDCVIRLIQINLDKEAESVTDVKRLVEIKKEKQRVSELKIFY